MQKSFFSDKIDLNIELDPSTSFPLYGEQEKILELVMNYLPLPYSISEFGCGKKCSLIIKKLIDLGIPAYALERGMIIERDLSPEALRQTNPQKRPHALTVENVLYHHLDLDDEMLRALLKEAGITVNAQRKVIRTGSYRVSNGKTNQFVQARSHIFTLVYFWDPKAEEVKQLVIDPTLDRDEFFHLSQLRKYLQSSESLIFTAPLLGEFRLDEAFLTEAQYKSFRRLTGHEHLSELSPEDHRSFVRRLTGAAEDGIGDPQTWTYANNLPPRNKELYSFLKIQTGAGNPFSAWVHEIIEARVNLQEERILPLIARIRQKEQEINLRQLIRMDARWAEEKLKPLKRLVNVLSTSISTRELADRLRNDERLYEHIQHKRGLNLLYGFSFRLRERIETLARISRNEQGEIDAAALNPRYIQATIECIKQMDQAGLQVFVDRVGNLHGLLVDEATARRLHDEPRLLREVAGAGICHHSHIDTVQDAGKYDGRLGVLSGIEVAHILHDLQRFFDLPTVYPARSRALFVSVFVGEEMTFTGQGVSMPGSAAVAGHSGAESIYRMTDHEGQVYRKRLLVMLRAIGRAQRKGAIRLVNELAENADHAADLLRACSDPQDFFTPHTYERHIEQGDYLDRQRTPLMLVHTIMGIHQEDFYFAGDRAEEGALEFDLRLRELVLQRKEYANVRITGGTFDALDAEEPLSPIPLDVGMRWTLFGERDHAGATRNENRRDAGIAAARMIERFRELVAGQNEARETKWSTLCGGVEFWPGVNRNVIPGSCSVTLGLLGEKIGADEAFYLQQQIRAFVAGTLSLPVSGGGEGIKSCEMQEVHYLNKHVRLRFSIDLRSERASTTAHFLDDLQQTLKEVTEKYQLTCERTIEQELTPYQLEETGQVLQLERSYGGSHNPNETQLARDVLRGILMQVGVSLEFLETDGHRPLNLFRFVYDRLPAGWKERCPHFVSGALHDTCNISRAMQSKKGEVTVE